ncbi:MAG: UTP--glucose-1-phosphate uridylyltransferase [Chlamydiae bacterium]|nr:UTP--glucose-1-phosphate uridylyltransferase [Chlamydiota bacterium]
MKELFHTLEELDQKEFGQKCKALSLAKQKKILDQVKQYDPALMKQLKGLLFSKRDIPSVAPIESYAVSGNLEDLYLGEELIRQGKVGCIILAGGQGSRLGGNLPKALTPVSLVKQKTLLQLFCEKTKAASKKTRKNLPLAIMTSPLNISTIQKYLVGKKYFGLSQQDLILFRQPLLPFFDEKGNFVFHPSKEIGEGPDGNGKVLFHFFHSGIWENWRDRGIEFVHLVSIDNPLADPFDANLLGFQARQKADVTLKAILREDEEEKIGIIAKQKDRVCVVEYSEIGEEIKAAKRKEGGYLFSLGNTGLFCFTMDFIGKIAEKTIDLPWHFSQKTVELLSRKVWKAEQYVFDLLFLSKKTEVICYPKKEIFSPLKNAKGKDSLKTVQKDLLAADQRQYHRITGIQVKNSSFELDQRFYYPDKELIKKWKGKALPNKKFIKS